MKNLLAPIFAILALLQSGGPCFGQGNTTLPTTLSSRLQGMLISADSSSRDMENDRVELEGNVQVIFKDQHLRAERATIDLRTKTIDAIGNVLIVSTEATYGGSRIKVDYESNTGLIINGYVQSGSVFIEGDLLQKLSDREFTATSANYTTCDNCPETWAFSGTRVRAELGGYAYIKNSIMKVGSVPVFWLPYLVVPLKSGRQTGLLTPGFESSSSGGLAYSQPFFWAMSKSQDSTWTLINYENRGQKYLLNYRYVLSPTSYGFFDGALLQDKAFFSNERFANFKDSSTEGSYGRWFMKYHHYYDLPDGFVHRAEINNASDLLYPSDFPTETRNSFDSAMENRMSITKNTDSQSYVLDAAYYINTQQTNPLASNSGAVHRLPEFRFSQTLQPVFSTGLLYSFDFNYANFARSGFSYDELNSTAASNQNSGKNRHLRSGGYYLVPDPNDENLKINQCTTENWESNKACYYSPTGNYDPEKDLIRTGQRLDGQLRIAKPVTVGKFDFLPSVGYRETQYQFPVGDTRNSIRRYLRTEVSARTTFRSIFGSNSAGDDGFFHRYKHEIQPEISYSSIPWVHHPPHPFFGNVSSADIPYTTGATISDNDLNSVYGIQYDYYDRVFDQKIYTLAILNKWVEKYWQKGGVPAYRQIVSWRLAQSYDAYQAERNSADAEVYSPISSEITANLDRLSLYQLANYFPYQRTTDLVTTVRTFNSRGEFFSLGHNLTNVITPGKAVDFDKRNEELVFSWMKSFVPLDVVALVKYGINDPAQKFNSKLKSFIYAIQAKLPGNCWTVTFIQGLDTKGEVQSKVNFDFAWDGSPSAPLPESVLSTFAL